MDPLRVESINGILAAWARLQHTPPFLDLDSLFESEFQCISAMRGGSIGDVSNVLFHQRTCFGVIEVRNEETAFYIQNHILAEITHSTLVTGFDHPIGPSLSGDFRENLVNNIV